MMIQQLIDEIDVWTSKERDYQSQLQRMTSTATPAALAAMRKHIEQAKKTRVELEGLLSEQLDALAA